VFAPGLRGRVDLQQGVDAVKAESGHQLLSRQALEGGRGRRQVADAGETLRGGLDVEVVLGSGEAFRERSSRNFVLDSLNLVGMIRELLVDDVGVSGAAVVVVDGVDDDGRSVLLTCRKREAKIFHNFSGRWRVGFDLFGLLWVFQLMLLK